MKRKPEYDTCRPDRLADRQADKNRTDSYQPIECQLVQVRMQDRLHPVEFHVDRTVTGQGTAGTLIQADIQLKHDTNSVVCLASNHVHQLNEIKTVSFFVFRSVRQVSGRKNWGHSLSSADTAAIGLPSLDRRLLIDTSQDCSVNRVGGGIWKLLQDRRRVATVWKDRSDSSRPVDGDLPGILRANRNRTKIRCEDD